MGDTLTLGINESQRDLLLQGLRFVSSSLRLDPRDPDEALDAARDERLAELRNLVDQLNAEPAGAV